MAGTPIAGGGAAAAPGPLIRTDVPTLIHYAMLVKLAEDVDPGATVYTPGKTFTVSYDSLNVNYTALMTFYANDLATEANPARATQIVSFGFVAQDDAGNMVIAVRGTEGIFEWLQDARFLDVPCPFLPGAGRTEDGFTAVYESLRETKDPSSKRLVDVVPGLARANSLTVCGHSLGGAVATLLALDIAANDTSVPRPTVYTYASPRTGNASFVDTYNQVVPNTCRVANRLDIVPKVPLPPEYQHVAGLFELNPKLSVKPDILCEHHLTTYMNLISRQGTGTVLPLNPECKGL